MKLRTFIIMGLLCMVGLDSFAQNEEWTEQHLRYAFPEICLNSAEIKGNQSGTYEYFDWPKHHGFISSIGIEAKRADDVEFRFISKMVDYENKPVLLVNNNLITFHKAMMN